MRHEWEERVAPVWQRLPLMADYDSMDLGLDTAGSWDDPEFADAIAQAGIQVGINDELSQLESATFVSEWDDESLRPWLDAQSAGERKYTNPEPHGARELVRPRIDNRD